MPQTRRSRRGIVPAPTPPTPGPGSPSSKALPAEELLRTPLPPAPIGTVKDRPQVLASQSGGTSRAEDTTRAAGYVADTTGTNVPPPGPPIDKSPANFEGLDGATASTKGKPSAGPAPVAKRTRRT